MPVTVVVGGQFGGEGKGKVAHFLAKEEGSIELLSNLVFSALIKRRPGPLSSLQFHL